MYYATFYVSVHLIILYVDALCQKWRINYEQSINDIVCNIISKTMNTQIDIDTKTVAFDCREELDIFVCENVTNMNKLLLQRIFSK